MRKRHLLQRAKDADHCVFLQQSALSSLYYSPCCVMNYIISHLLPYTTRALTDINDLGKVGFPRVRAITNT